VTALAETASFTFAELGIRFRHVLSLLAVFAILAVALPTAFGAGAWNGGIDAGRFFAQDASSHTMKPLASAERRLRPGRP
jgi:hypothetical protein